MSANEHDVDDAESKAAAEAAERDDPAAAARRWLLESTSGTLSTISVTNGLEGWPFGSIVPYALDARGRPILLTARIALHTKNAKADSRASLFVHQQNVEGDPQAGWRITVCGRLELITDATEVADANARYVEKVPSSVTYFGTHDFEYWRLSVDRVRYIGGFGKICWIDGKDVTRDPVGGGIADAAARIVEHMNGDHAENMREMCRGLYGFSPEDVKMTSVDRTGFFVSTHAPERLLHFSFQREVNADGVREAVIEVLKRARKAVAQQ
jgi:heme iron utilization protein